MREGLPPSPRLFLLRDIRRARDTRGILRSNDNVDSLCSIVFSERDIDWHYAFANPDGLESFNSRRARFIHRVIPREEYNSPGRRQCR